MEVMYALANNKKLSEKRRRSIRRASRASPTSPPSSPPSSPPDSTSPDAEVDSKGALVDVGLRAESEEDSIEAIAADAPTASNVISSTKAANAFATAASSSSATAPQSTVVKGRAWGKARRLSVTTAAATKAWHSDVDSVYKRLGLACLSQHTLCSGIFWRGSAGYTRAQTVMVLLNSIYLELLLVVWFYQAPESTTASTVPVSSDGTVIPSAKTQAVSTSSDGDAMVINPVAVVVGGMVSAAICIPGCLCFAWFYDPIIFVRLGKWLLKFIFLWPYYLFVCVTRRTARIAPNVATGINEAINNVTDKVDAAAHALGVDETLDKVGDTVDSAARALGIEGDEGFTAPPTAPVYSHASLEETLFRASLERMWRARDWPAVRHILLGWTLNHLAFWTQFIIFAAYACELFESNEHRDLTREAPAGSVDELWATWTFSVVHRFVLFEPTLILAAKGAPMLFASAFCTNCCGESIANAMGLVLELVIQVIKEIVRG